MSTFIASFLWAQKYGNKDLLLSVSIMYLIDEIYKISSIIYFSYNSYSDILLLDDNKQLET